MGCGPSIRSINSYWNPQSWHVIKKRRAVRSELYQLAGNGLPCRRAYSSMLSFSGSNSSSTLQSVLPQLEQTIISLFLIDFFLVEKSVTASEALALKCNVPHLLRSNFQLYPSNRGTVAAFACNNHLTLFSRGLRFLAALLALRVLAAKMAPAAFFDTPCFLAILL